MPLVMRPSRSWTGSADIRGNFSCGFFDDQVVKPRLAYHMLLGGDPSRQDQGQGLTSAQFLRNLESNLKGVPIMGPEQASRRGDGGIVVDAPDDPTQA